MTEKGKEDNMQGPSRITTMSEEGIVPRELLEVEKNERDDLILRLDGGERWQFTLNEVDGRNCESLSDLDRADFNPGDIASCHRMRDEDTGKLTTETKMDVSAHVFGVYPDLDPEKHSQFIGVIALYGWLRVLPTLQGRDIPEKTVTVSRDCEEVTADGKTYPCTSKMRKFLEYFKEDRDNAKELGISQIAEEIGLRGTSNAYPSRVLPGICEFILEKKENSPYAGIYRVRDDVEFSE